MKKSSEEEITTWDLERESRRFVDVEHHPTNHSAMALIMVLSLKVDL